MPKADTMGLRLWRRAVRGPAATQIPAPGYDDPFDPTDWCGYNGRIRHRWRLWQDLPPALRNPVHPALRFGA